MKQRLVELDILRGLAIIGVILIHISSPISNNIGDIFSAEAISIGLDQISRFAVPVFLFLSGFGLTVSNKAEQKYLTFLRLRISKIITLYLIWSMVYFLLLKQTLNPLLFVKDFLTGGAFYHLYYVPLIVLFYILYPLLLKIGRSNVGLMLVLMISILSQIGDLFVNASYLNSTLNFLNWIFYFVLGIWMANNFSDKLKKISSKKSLIVVAFAMVVIGIYAETYFTINELGKALATTTMRPSIIVYSVLFILVVFSFKWENKLVNKTLIMLSDKSYGIYLSHALVLSAYATLYTKLGLNLESLTFLISAFLIVTVTSIVITMLLDKSIASLKTKMKREEKKVFTT